MWNSSENPSFERTHFANLDRLSKILGNQVFVNLKADAKTIFATIKSA